MALLLYLAMGDPSDPHLTLPLYVKVRGGSASIFFVPGTFQIRSPSILLKTKLSEPFESLSEFLRLIFINLPTTPLHFLLEECSLYPQNSYQYLE